MKTGKKAAVDSAAPDRGDGYAVALRWTALDPGRTMDAVFAINRAKDWDDFREASELFEVPSQNLVYADTDGHIGYTLPGKIPTRAEKHDGSVPAPAGTPTTSGPAGSTRTNCPTSSTRSAATSSPPTRPSSTRTTRTR